MCACTVQDLTSPREGKVGAQVRSAQHLVRCSAKVAALLQLVSFFFFGLGNYEFFCVAFVIYLFHKGHYVIEAANGFSPNH